MSKLIIFDTETTGLEEEDRIIQVGAIIVDLENKEYIEKYDELCSTTDILIKIEAMATHGIRESKIKDKPLFNDTKFKKRLEELNNENNYLIAHNLGFDLRMVAKEGFESKLKRIDTLQCAKHLYGIGDEINGYKLPNYKLQTFRYMMLTEDEEGKEAENLGVGIKVHKAIGDVVILKLFLRKLYEKVKKIYAITNKKEIMDKMVELTKDPLPADRVYITFGKHKCSNVKEVYEKDKRWLEWYCGTENPFGDIVQAFDALEKA